MLKLPNRNDLDPYNRQYDVAIDLSSKLLRSKLISILFKIRDVVYVQITNISLASRLMCRSRSLTAVTSHRLAGEIRRTLSSLVISYYGANHARSSCNHFELPGEQQPDRPVLLNDNYAGLVKT